MEHQTWRSRRLDDRELVYAWADGLGALRQERGPGESRRASQEGGRGQALRGYLPEEFPKRRNRPSGCNRAVKQGRREKHETVLTALSRAVWQRRPQPNLMIHSDRGIQYCCDGFRKAVDAHQFVQSMSKKADCWDNAVSESFFKTLKTEWLYHVDLINLDHAERELFEYIEMFYNNQRLHAYLDYVSPALFERLSMKKAA